jgi:hypothetical protein
MKKFILRRKIIYTETAEVEAESWDAAKAMLRDDSVEFETNHDGMLHDETIEYIGDS